MRHEIASTTGDTAGVTADLGQDPTVGLTYEAFPFLCTMCGQDIICEDCGQESAPGYCLEAEDERAPHTNAKQSSSATATATATASTST